MKTLMKRSLFVLSILGALVAGVLLYVGLFGIREPKEYRKETLIRLSELSLSVERFRGICGQLPQKLTDLTMSESQMCPNGKFPFWNKPLEDSWGHVLIYEPTNSGFQIRSLGKDGLPGGIGDDADIAMP